MKNYKMIKFTWTGKKWKQTSKLVARHTGARHEKKPVGISHRETKKYQIRILGTPKAGESQLRVPGQNGDLWTGAPVPLEIADDKQYTNILPIFPGPSEHSGPQVFCPPPWPPPSRRPWVLLSPWNAVMFCKQA